MADALLKMQNALLEAKFPGAAQSAGPAKPQSSAVPTQAAARPAQLEELKDKGLITDAEYEARRKAIVDSL